MALNKSTLMIRDYENIRTMLRDIYIYGCFNKDDYKEKQGISGRKYDNEQQRISAYLPEGFIQKRRIDRKSVLYCSYDGMDTSNNYLADTYRNKSFTALDIMAFFFVQQLLGESAEMTAGEILEALPTLNEEAVFTKDNLRVKLEELVERGFIDQIKIGRNVKYRLGKDIWEDFTDSELADIYTYLEFMKNVSPLEMPYYFLQDKLKLYMFSERDLEVPEHKIFSFKHNHLFNVLDNDVLLEIIKAKAKYKLLSIAFNNGKSTALVIPGEIIYDCVYGRQYLYCHELSEEQNIVVRIDKISEASIERDMTDEERAEADNLMHYSDSCWCTSSKDSELTEIVIHFMFDEEREQFILSRIISEGHGGEIRKLSDGKYEFKLSVADPDEMIPWIRSFGERAKVISSGGYGTEEKIKNDWKRAIEKYDSL